MKEESHNSHLFHQDSFSRILRTPSDYLHNPATKHWKSIALVL